MQTQANIVPPDAATPVVAAHKSLSDADLDQKIRGQITMIDRAVVEVKKCKKSAVISAWRAGQFLIEKKARIGHGNWGPWLEKIGISPSSAKNYMRIANQIASTVDLESSISKTLGKLTAPPTANPKSKPKLRPVLAVVEPVEPEADSSAAVIKTLESQLNESQERISIMEESADPKSREVINKINNQRALIQTLKSSVADWQSKCADARRENTVLKRRKRKLEKEAA